MITTLLMDDKLKLLKKSRLTIPMEDRDDYLNEFQLDNEGDLVFTKFNRVNNENIGKAAFVIKYAQADSFHDQRTEYRKKHIWTRYISKPDNYNKRYFLTSFYYKQRRGNIDGFYFYIWDKATGAAYYRRYHVLSAKNCAKKPEAIQI